MSNPFKRIDSRFGLEPLPPGNKPVFILSTVWRSGSTLLQRTLCTDPDILMWGEPYADCNLFTSMARSAIALNQKAWPSPRFFATGAEQVFDELENYFIANLYPEISYLRAGHRALLDRTFSDSAKAKGRERFGSKFVRLGLEEANYLEWMYPDAKFIFLIRNPWDCWRSYKGYAWTYRWPKQVVSKVAQFAMLWKKQTSGLLQFAGPNSMVLRYEDFLKDDFDWDGLREFTELPNITKKATKQRIRGVLTEPLPVVESDLAVIQSICGPLANQLGYFGLKETKLEFLLP
jgi:hypothetical protein